jgi:hypothetical protein
MKIVKKCRIMNNFPRSLAGIFSVRKRKDIFSELFGQVAQISLRSSENGLESNRMTVALPVGTAA